MAVNAELYLRSSSARLRARTSDPESVSPFGFVTAADGLPIKITELATPESTQSTHDWTARAVANSRPLAVLPPLTPAAMWQGLLPELERELGSELRAFRKRMLASRIPVDYLSDMFAGRRSGAWAIYRDVRCVEGEGDVEFCLYVRRGKDQLAVWEGAGAPDSLRANFSRPVPGPPPAADDVRRGLAAALVRHRISTFR